jgi:hypothetical protein
MSVVVGTGERLGTVVGGGVGTAEGASPSSVQKSHVSSHRVAYAHVGQK